MYTASKHTENDGFPHFQQGVALVVEGGTLLLTKLTERQTTLRAEEAIAHNGFDRTAGTRHIRVHPRRAVDKDRPRVPSSGWIRKSEEEVAGVVELQLVVSVNTRGAQVVVGAGAALEAHSTQGIGRAVVTYHASVLHHRCRGRWVGGR